MTKYSRLSPPQLLKILSFGHFQTLSSRPSSLSLSRLPVIIDLFHVSTNNGTQSRSSWTNIQQTYENVHHNLILVLLFAHTEAEGEMSIAGCQALMVISFMDTHCFKKVVKLHLIFYNFMREMPSRNPIFNFWLKACFRRELRPEQSCPLITILNYHLKAASGKTNRQRLRNNGRSGQHIVCKTTVYFSTAGLFPRKELSPLPTNKSIETTFTTFYNKIVSRYILVFLFKLEWDTCIMAIVIKSRHLRCIFEIKFITIFG